MAIMRFRASFTFATLFSISMLPPLGGCTGQSAAAVEAVSNAHTGASSRERIVFGYFDHTAAWYRERKGFNVRQTVPHTWGRRAPEITVILYNDIVRVIGQGSSRDVVDDIRRRIAHRDQDIRTYLRDASIANVRVLLQLPADVVRHWSEEPAAMRAVLLDFIRRWRDEEALAGFYIYDEPELRRIPGRTLQEISSIIAKEARPDAALTAISMSSSALGNRRHILEAYVGLSPPPFDVLIVNRYPFYRTYGTPASRKDTAFETGKLGLTESHARRVNLLDNEFSNLGNYHDFLLEAQDAVSAHGVEVYAAVQAYGLRDDCQGQHCKVVKERQARRSPSWAEMLNQVASAWVSDMDGVLLYSHYFSLYNRPLRERISNLETLFSRVFIYVPEQGDLISVREAQNFLMRWFDPGGEVHSAYARPSSRADYYYLVVVNSSDDRKEVAIETHPALGVREIHELRFDRQGKMLEPALHCVADGDGCEDLGIELGKFEVRLFELKVAEGLAAGLSSG